MVKKMTRIIDRDNNKFIQSNAMESNTKNNILGKMKFYYIINSELSVSRLELLLPKKILGDNQTESRPFITIEVLVWHLS